MARIHGACMFRDEGNGCLSSKYINDLDFIASTEACKRTSTNRPEIPFHGIYQTSWLNVLENGSVTHTFGTLGIEWSDRDGYRLSWTPASRGMNYEGVGMIANGILVASYWSTPRNEI